MIADRLEIRIVRLEIGVELRLALFHRVQSGQP
jgi:hypothetical protein